jgi:hypothetical protein
MEGRSSSTDGESRERYSPPAAKRTNSSTMLAATRGENSRMVRLAAAMARASAGTSTNEMGTAANQRVATLRAGARYVSSTGSCSGLAFG